MSRRVFMGVFESEQDLLGATRAVRDRGWTIDDIYSPYAVHGLEHIAGFPRSWLPIACFILATIGGSLFTWFAFWATAVDWPLNVSGKPWNSLPAFVPIIFEMVVLTAGLGSTLVLFIALGLWPGKKAKMPHPRVTDDRFALLIQETDATFSPVEAEALCARFNAVETEEFER